MSNNNTDQVCFRTMIGGQALMEGILMRGRTSRPSSAGRKTASSKRSSP